MTNANQNWESQEVIRVLINDEDAWNTLRNHSADAIEQYVRSGQAPSRLYTQFVRPPRSTFDDVDWDAVSDAMIGDLGDLADVTPDDESDDATDNDPWADMKEQLEWVLPTLPFCVDYNGARYHYQCAELVFGKKKIDRARRRKVVNMHVTYGGDWVAEALEMIEQGEAPHSTCDCCRGSLYDDPWFVVVQNVLPGFEEYAA